MRAHILNFALLVTAAIVANTAHAADPAIGCYRIDDAKKRADGSIELTDTAATGNPWYTSGGKLVVLRPVNVPWKYGNWIRKGGAIFVTLNDGLNRGLSVVMEESATGVNAFAAIIPDLKKYYHPQHGDKVGTETGPITLARQSCAPPT